MSYACNTEKLADKPAKAALTGYFEANSAELNGIFNLPHGCGKLIGGSLGAKDPCYTFQSSIISPLSIR
ncbi:hypothetical protein D3C71_2007950 [compost metagenome]